MSNEVKNSQLIKEKLHKIFKKNEDVDYIIDGFKNLLDQYNPSTPFKKKISNKTAYLITYADTIFENGVNKLKTFSKFIKNLDDCISDVHFLPFFPYSSDDGFSVKDFFKIRTDIGTWEELQHLSKNIDLMYDAVINHVSKDSIFFKKYKSCDSEYANYFIEVKKENQCLYKKTRRPRVQPLFHDYKMDNGEVKSLWTTFSEDQIDLNFDDPKLFLKIAEILLFYIKNGAKSIRLDAIGFAFKRANTESMHLFETHLAIQIYKLLITTNYPDIIIITETNVPHVENISYFGNKNDSEADMIYQFTLPPLTLYSFFSNDATAISSWASSLKPISGKKTFFNFLASHDGIGLTPANDYICSDDLKKLCNIILERGGKVSYKKNSDGGEIPYELNCNFFDALTDHKLDISLRLSAFYCSHAILLSFIGVPAIYIHSLLGSKNDYELLKKTSQNRSINRGKILLDDLQKELKDKTSQRYNIFNFLKQLLKIRMKYKAFSPFGLFEVVSFDKRVFSYYRTHDDETILCLFNVSQEEVIQKDIKGFDIVNQVDISSLILKPYDFKWIKIN